MAAVEFNWTVRRLTQLENAVRRYNRVTAEMNKSGLYDIRYAKVTVEEAKSRVTDYNAFRREISKLNRFSPGSKSRKNFQLVETDTGMHWLPKAKVMSDGKVFPVQEKNRYVRAQKKYNRYVEGLKEKYFPDASEREMAFNFIDSDLAPVPEGSSKVSPEHIEHMLKTSATGYFESYAEMWLEGGGDYTVADIIYYLIEHYPAELEYFKHVPDERIQIEWVYKVFYQWGDVSKKKSQKAVNKALERVAAEETRGVRFWRELYRKITGDDWDAYGEEGLSA